MHPPPPVLPQKCLMYSFHAVFGHFTQITPSSLKLTANGKPSVPRLIAIKRIQWWCLRCLMQTGNDLVRQIFFPKRKNCQFKQKFGTQTNLNMQNSMVLFTFLVFDQKYPFWGNLIQKKQKLSLSAKVQYLENSNMQNSIVVHFFQF